MTLRHNDKSFGAVYVTLSTIVDSQMAFKGKYMKQGTGMRNGKERIVAL